MLSILAPVLSTPLLKVPILIPDAVLTYINLTAPMPPPAKDERDKYPTKDWFSDNHHVQTQCINVCKIALMSLMAAETTTILAQHFPSRLSTLLLSYLAPSAPSPLTLAPTPRFFLTSALVLAGGLVRLWTYRTLGRFFRFQLSLVAGHRLVTAGPYAWVRHPSYTAATLCSWGNLLLLSGPGSYFAESGLGRTLWGRAAGAGVAAYLLFLHSNLMFTRVDKEDAVLRESFGEEWEEWAKRTPYKLIPYVY
ncbi:hypothetical protein C2E23DRAFT_770003 [Lenzites betulinus]|nr:hypothetical protein C2E23DRAFT_770003 [Lenzites betulinus]